MRDIGVADKDGGPPLTCSRLTSRLALMDELCEHFLNAYLEKAKVSRERVLLWETCDLFTAMSHAWTKVRLARIEPRLTVLRHYLSAISDLKTAAPGL